MKYDVIEIDKLVPHPANFPGRELKMAEEMLRSIEEHGVQVPLMVRDTQKTNEIVKHLTANGVLATGLNFPVVPKGDEEIRFQVCADHTESDIDYVIGVLREYQETH